MRGSCRVWYQQTSYPPGAKHTLPSWIAVRVMYANLATLIETSGVLDAGAFAMVSCGAETLPICVERPREDQNDQTHKDRYEDPHVLNEPTHVLPPDQPAQAPRYTSIPAAHATKGSWHPAFEPLPKRQIHPTQDNAISSYGEKHRRLDLPE